MIHAELIQNVTNFVRDQGVSDDTVRQLRQTHAGIHFTYCMDDDISGARPFLECQGFNIYLVDSRDHCSVLTHSVDLASGLVIAEVIEDW